MLAPLLAVALAVPVAVPTPVLVELFTSEGCSSCPSADAVLRDLEQKQPVPGALVIALEEHVDYWNYIGWKDPFSSAAFTDRQKAYAASFGRGRIYTPQMVVDGAHELVGSDAAAARDAILVSTQAKKAALKLAVQGGKVIIEVEGLDGGEPAEVRLAVAELNLSSKVERGENEGRTLLHAAVARTLETVGAIGKGQKATRVEGELRIAPGWNRAQLRIVAFVQGTQSHRVLAAAVVPAG